MHCQTKDRKQITVLQLETFNFGELTRFDMILKTMPFEIGNFQNISGNITYEERRLLFKEKKVVIYGCFILFHVLDQEKKHDLPKLGAIIVVQ